MKIYVSTGIKNKGNGTQRRPFNSIKNAFKLIDKMYKLDSEEDEEWIHIKSHIHAIRGYVSPEKWNQIQSVQNGDEPSVQFCLHTNYPNFLSFRGTGFIVSTSTDWQTV